MPPLKGSFAFALFREQDGRIIASSVRSSANEVRKDRDNDEREYYKGVWKGYRVQKVLILPVDFD